MNELLTQDTSDGQPEHAQAGLAVRGVPARAGPADRRAAGDPPHAEARKLAEHGRDRAVGAEPAMPGPADRDEGGVGAGGGGVGGAPQREDGGGEVASYHGGPPDQTIRRLYPTIR